LIGQITVGGTATFAHAEGLGSVRLLTDGSGASAGMWEYDAFGETRAQTGTSLPIGFVGEQRDDESGSVQVRSRRGGRAGQIARF
jgi:hypothetical protein